MGANRFTRAHLWGAPIAAPRDCTCTQPQGHRAHQLETVPLRFICSISLDMYRLSTHPPYSDELNVDESKSTIEGFPNSRVSSTTFPGNDSVIPTLPLSHPPKYRRIYGLNSRFDKMLQEVNPLSHASRHSYRRRARVHSSSSSSVSSYEIPKTPMDAYPDSGYISKTVGKDFAVIKVKRQVPQPEMRNGAAHIAASVVVHGQAIMESVAQEQLPEWLNDTLATLPHSHPARCLVTAPAAQVDLPGPGDDLSWMPNHAEGSPVFAFEAPVDDHQPGVLRRETLPFETDASDADSAAQVQALSSCGEPLARRIDEADILEASASRPVPFSTPGPAYEISQTPVFYRSRRSFSALPMSQSTGNGSQPVLGVPPPFSIPGPFISSRSEHRDISDVNCTMSPNMPRNVALLEIEDEGVRRLWSARSSELDPADAASVPYVKTQHVNNRSNDFSPRPKATRSGSTDPVSTPELIRQTDSLIYLDFLTEGLSPSPTPETGLILQRGTAAFSASPGRPAYGLTEDLANQTSDPGDKAELIPTGYLVSPKPAIPMANEASPCAHPRPPTAALPSDDNIQLVTGLIWPGLGAPSMLLQTPPKSQRLLVHQSFSPPRLPWVVPDARTPDNPRKPVGEDAASVDWMDIMRAYVPAAMVAEPMQEIGAFAPAPGIFLSPLRGPLQDGKVTRAMGSEAAPRRQNEDLSQRAGSVVSDRDTIESWSS
ncbi:hypothetical protein BC834DRAFT_873392 [Gloeopeniophorella convolvens]|nr:hypothetical protein BC834DRAFT_873392 [Gloeopeniophorella convolvens]